MKFNKDLKSVIKCKSIAEEKPAIESLSKLTVIQLSMVLHYLAPRFTAQEDCIQLLADAYGREQPWAAEAYYKRVRAQFTKQYLLNKIVSAYSTNNRFCA
jgi:hypothetical protein